MFRFGNAIISELRILDSTGVFTVKISGNQPPAKDMANFMPTSRSPNREKKSLAAWDPFNVRKFEDTLRCTTAFVCSNLRDIATTIGIRGECTNLCLSLLTSSACSLKMPENAVCYFVAPGSLH